MEITLQTARNIQLDALGLLIPPRQPAQKTDVLSVIRRLGALQIDTIHVIARSPYLVLWSRLGAYQPAWLDELLAEGALFEYWAHAACFIPIEDFRLYRGWMQEEFHPWFSAHQWINEHPAAVETVMSAIRERGAVRSAEFERKDGRGSGWWDWKEEKIALEALHTTGELMIASRKNFQRIYDLTERVYPGWQEEQTATREEVYRALVERAVGNLGIAQPGWIPDYYRLGKTETRRVVADLLSAGRLAEVSIPELGETPCLCTPQTLERLQSGSAAELAPAYTTLLSPFDPLVWDRARVRALFDFDYSIECYLPQAKRKYGYFNLPILHRGRLVGRLDPKAHRKEGVFQVKNLILEPGVVPGDDLAADLAQAIQSCAAWHQTPQVQIDRVDPPGWAPPLLSAFPSGVLVEAAVPSAL